MINLSFEILKDNVNDIEKSVETAMKCFNPKADKEKSIKRLKQMLKEKNCLVCVAKSCEEVIGIVYAYITPRILSDTKLATLWCLGIDNKFHNKGVGKKLLKFACDECYKLNCNEVKLTTSKTNIACQKASEDVGFEQHYAYTKEL